MKRLSGLLSIFIVPILFCADGVPAQNRTFSEIPEILLGLKLDRSSSLTFMDVDGDGDLDVLVANGRHWPQIMVSTLGIVPAVSMKGFDLDVQTVEPMQ